MLTITNKYSEYKINAEKVPEPIDPSACVEEYHTDVLIAGAGIGGICAALRAAELGLQVIVTEKTSSWSARGAHIGAINSRLAKECGKTIDEEELIRKWIRATGNRADEQMIRFFVYNSGKAMDWLLDKMDEAGISYGLWDGYYKGPTYTEYPGTHLFDGEVAAVVREMYRMAVEKGVRFLFNCPCVQLMQESGRVSGAVAKGKEGYVTIHAGKGVILATGDIGGSEALCRKYAPEALATAGHLYNPPGANTGDGHLMGLWAGGMMQDAPFPTTLHPQYLSRLQYFYLFVGPDGKRFMNEDTWVQSRSLAAMRQDGGYAFSVFDSKWPEEVEKSLPAGGGLFWDNGRRRLGEKWTPEGDNKIIESNIKNGNGFTADTIEELAVKMNVPAEAFKKTVERYNELAASGKDTDFGKRPELLTSITKPPFYAMKFAAATLCIVGGLLTDLKYHVLRANGDIVKGLYAIGNVSGGLYASDYPLLIPGSTHGRALLSGCTAAEDCAVGIKDGV